MAEIIPAILPEYFKEIEKKVSSIFKLTPNVQIDICDGVYVASKTWPFVIKDDVYLADIIEEKMGMPFWENTNYELDLMIKNPDKRFDEFVKLGPSRMIFHLNSFPSHENALDFFEQMDPFYKNSIELGLAISAEEDLENIKPFIEHIKFVQVMGINNIGFQGEPFNQNTYEQIKSIKNLFPEMKVSVDGGVNLENKDALIEAGADRLVSGSAIWQSPDPIATIESFQN